MLHKRRTWSISPVVSAEELANKLTQYTWCGCNAFLLADYLFVNDSTGPDGAQEYGVLRRDTNSTFVQIESITFSWCNWDRALEYIQSALAGAFDAYCFDWVAAERFQTPRQHGICPLCA